MKKLITFLCITLFCNMLNAQLGVQIVNDPSNLAKIKEVLEAGQQQIKKIEEQTTVLQEAQKRLMKVNSYVSSANTIKKTVEQQKEIINFFNGDMISIKGDALSPKALLAYVNRIESYRTRIFDNNNYLLKILSDNAFQMTDYERISSVNQINTENKEILMLAREEKRRYEYLNRQIKILDSLKK